VGSSVQSPLLPKKRKKERTNERKEGRGEEREREKERKCQDTFKGQNGKLKQMREYSKEAQMGFCSKMTKF
jgi:hypothetical protein